MKRWAYLTGAVVLALAVTCAIAQGGGDTRGDGDFLLAGAAQNAQDPENPANDVIKIDNTILPGQCVAPTYLNCTYGAISRVVNTKIANLDNMLEFKSYFQNRSCGGGSPRMVLSIDTNGDGIPDGEVDGYTAPPFAGCPPNRWQYDDVTDELPRWDISFLPGLTINCAVPAITPLCPFATNSGYIPWNVLETAITALYPLHTVCSAALIDDSGWMPAAAGTAYYDIVSMGRATWEDHADTGGRGFAKGCGRSTLPDQEADGDHNHHGEHDNQDDDWQKKQHERYDH
jgi:hypothetical protein